MTNAEKYYVFLSDGDWEADWYICDSYEKAKEIVDEYFEYYGHYSIVKGVKIESDD